MKIAQLSALSAAILLATSAQANSFVDDSSLNIELRNYYKHTTTDTGAKDSNDQWAQGIRVDYSSGYFENVVGVDLGAYYSLKLGASADSDVGLLMKDGDNAKSYGKNAYSIKFNLADMGVLKYGRMFLNLPLLNDSDSRVLPSLTEAFYGNVSYEGLTAHAAWAKKGNSKTQSGFENYGTDEEKEPVKTVGAAYDFGNGMTLAADYATQADAAKKYLIEATFATEMEGTTLNFAANYGKVSAIGAAKDAQGTGDTSQNAFGVKVGANLGSASLGLAYTKVKDTTLGSYEDSWTGGEDSTGHFGYNASQISDFDARGQKAWGIKAGYDFSEMVPGLNASAKYVKGSYEGGDENEYNIDVMYAVPQLEGLSARLRYAKNTNDQDNVADDKITTDSRVIVQYKVSVF
ncbi:hypothetical protein EOPP23_20435 [Endozoicomonas sp. OPT23]|uniref:OprD family outer membrane porin n=1 Tax=Endozoicomonas sp. OPT23 TaxID=2072845 RepID=UPI00129B1249|nr:OprD family outer membrane porin [Endozoicomonas sp. OPT23]MRI35330.1 hypothetical protein [Endozoicomonas sp. OPT23]